MILTPEQVEEIRIAHRFPPSITTYISVLDSHEALRAQLAEADHKFESMYEDMVEEREGLIRDLAEREKEVERLQEALRNVGHWADASLAAIDNLREDMALAVRDAYPLIKGIPPKIEQCPICGTIGVHGCCGSKKPFDGSFR